MMEEILTRLLKNKDEKKLELYRTFLNHMEDLKLEREMILKMLPSSSTKVDSGEVVSKKRKSPEAPLDQVKLSPDQKRSMNEYEQYLASHGYSTDLNKLKKEHLIDLLEKRGIKTFTMKALKAQMIETFKASFEALPFATLEPTISKAETPFKNSDNQTENTNDVQEVQAPKSVRKGSLMSEFRNLVHGTTNNHSTSEESEWAKKEFQNRQSRHRDSQIRKSMLEDGSCDKPEKESEVNEKPDASPVEMSSIILTGKQGNATPTWVDVASPLQIENKAPIANDPLNSTSSSQLSSESDSVSEVKPKKAIAPVPAEKKFVVPALEKAKMLKAAEELKLQNKKKEQELKQANLVQKPTTDKSTVSKTVQPIIQQAKKVPVTVNPKPVSAPPLNQQPVAAPVLSLLPQPCAPTQSLPVESTQENVSTPINPTPAAVNREAPTEKPKADRILQEIPKSTEILPEKEQTENQKSDEYVIESRDDSSDGGSSDTDDETEKKQQQQIPDWARGDLLKQALERQYGLNGQPPMDPDLIFPEIQTCNLEEIFGQRSGLTRKYASRTSSAHWDADELTPVEKRQYRAHMGYDAVHKIQV